MLPIKSFMKNRNLVSDSSVGDKKKAYSFYSIMGWLAHFGGRKKRKKKQVIKSSFISLLLHLFFFFRQCSISCTRARTHTNWTEWELKLAAFHLMWRRHLSQHRALHLQAILLWHFILSPSFCTSRVKKAS